MILIRFVLISFIAYLLIRSFLRYSEKEKPVPSRPEPEKRSNLNDKKISKEIGEYIDYEEVDK